GGHGNILRRPVPGSHYIDIYGVRTQRQLCDRFARYDRQHYGVPAFAKAAPEALLQNAGRSGRSQSSDRRGKAQFLTAAGGRCHVPRFAGDSTGTRNTAVSRRTAGCSAAFAFRSIADPGGEPTETG